jgi:hypothetical protein
MSYAIFMASTTSGSFVYLVKNGGIYWLSFVFNLLITILSFAFATDLNVIRNQRSTTPMFMIPSQSQTIVQMAQQQQYSSPSNAWEPPPDYNSIPSNAWEPPPDYNSALNTNQPNIDEKIVC